MKRHLVIGGLVVALGLAAWLVVSDGAHERSPRLAESARAEAVPEAVSRVEPASTPAAPEQSEQAPSPAPATASRRSVEEEELAGGVQVEGLVVFPPGTPADERVFVEARGKKPESGAYHEVEVARDGSFRATFGAGTKLGRLALRGRYVHLDDPVRWKAGDPQPVRLEPRLGARIEGRVVPPPGSAVEPGDLVRLVELEPFGEPWFPARMHELELEDGGEFGATVPAGEGRWRVDYDGAAWLGRSDIFSVTAGEVTRLELTLVPGVVLAGRVLDEEAGPVAGALVTAGVPGEDPYDEDPSDHGPRRAESGADGSFRLRALPPGPLRMSAYLKGFSWAYLELEHAEAGAHEGLELVLARGLAIRGRLQWPDGTPAVGKLELSDARGLPAASLIGGLQSDADGSFSASGLDEGLYTLRAEAPHVEEYEVTSELTGRVRTKKKRSLWQVEQREVAAGTRGLVLTLDPGHTLRGRVLDPAGAPQQDFELTAFRANEGSFMPWEMQSFERRFRGPDGSFELEQLLPGRWRVVASAEGWIDSEAVVVDSASGQELELHLRAPVRVRGRVLDRAGEPVPSATVSVGQVDVFGEGKARYESVAAEPSGAFLVPHLIPGGLTVQAFAEGYAPSEVRRLELPAGVSDELVLVLARAATLTGSVRTLAGESAAGLTVWLTGAREAGFEAQSVALDASGAFRFDDLPPGEYHATVELQGGVTLASTVVLAEGESVHVELAPAAASYVRLSGRVTLAGQALAGATLWTRREDEGFRGGESSRVVLGEDGLYGLTLPGGGRYRLHVSHWNELDHGWTQWAGLIDVPEAREHRADFAFERALVRGSVRDREGRALAAVKVEAAADEGSGAPAQYITGALTRDDGSFELSLGPGVSRVSAGGAADEITDGRWALVTRSVTLAAGQELGGLDFVLGLGGSLRGRVLDAGGAPVPSATLWKIEDGVWGWLATCADDGTFTCDGLSPGEFVAWAYNDHGISYAQQIRIEADMRTETEFELRPATRAYVTLTGFHDPAARLTVVDAEGRDTGAVNVSGSEAVTGPLVAGRYTLRIEHDGKSTVHTFEVRGDEREVRFTLALE